MDAGVGAAVVYNETNETSYRKAHHKPIAAYMWSTFHTKLNEIKNTVLPWQPYHYPDDRK